VNEKTNEEEFHRSLDGWMERQKNQGGVVSQAENPTERRKALAENLRGVRANRELARTRLAAASDSVDNASAIYGELRKAYTEARRALDGGDTSVELIEKLDHLSDAVTEADNNLQKARSEYGTAQSVLRDLDREEQKILNLIAKYLPDQYLLPEVPRSGPRCDHDAVDMVPCKDCNR
jgi:multidrug resistance efflux pump